MHRWVRLRLDLESENLVEEELTQRRPQSARPSLRGCATSTTIMTTFQSVNVTLGTRDSSEATTPTTPRAPIELVSRAPPLPIRDGPESTTPTRDSFAAANGKRALPISPLTSTFTESQWAGRNEKRDEADSQQSSKRASQDFDMGRSDDGEDASDAESVDDESGRPSKKKKKGQRFFCTDYPPCKLSFTRSEHLARHIRFVAPLDITQKAKDIYVIQEAHGREAISMSLRTAILAAG